MKKKIFVVAAIILSSRLTGQVQDTTGKTLDEVVLTANKYPKKQSETGKVITVINREQLERNSGRSVAEIINTVAGTTIIGANNNLGTNLRTGIRGSSDGNVLILVDGIPTNDPSVNKNYFDLNFFVVDQIERIEILKGGQSTLYGSDAVAGVINIITRKNSGKKIGINAGLTGGSYGTFKQNAGISGNTNVVNYSVQYAHINSDGFSSAFDSSGKGNFDKDAYNQHVVNNTLAFKLGRRLQLRTVAGYTYYAADLDAQAFNDEKDYTVENKNVRGGIGIDYNHNKGSLRFNYLFNYVSRDYEDDSVFKGSPFVDYSVSNFIGRTHFAELYNSWKWTSWELLTGVDYRMNNMFQYSRAIYPFFPTSPAEAKAKMNQFSPYASLIYKISSFTVEAGGRLNVHSEYGSNVTYTLNPSYTVNRTVKLFANLYSAFKTPTLYQLFDPVYGKDDLKPEKGIIGEAGISLSPVNNLNFRLVGFYRKSKDVIEFIITDPNTFASQYQNISEQKNYGVEAEFAFRRNQWDVTANYTYTDGKTTADYDGTGMPLGKDTTYYNLYRIPKHAFNASVGYAFSKGLYVNARFKSVGERFEPVYGAAPVEMESFYTVDLYGEYAMKTQWRIFIDLRNITNQQYFDILGYNSRKFNFTAGVYFNL